MSPNVSRFEDTQGAFRALADPTRRQILTHLSTGDMTIGQVCDRFDVTRGAIKKHLTILQEGGLITVHPRGRERINRIRPMALKPVSDWLGYFDRFWDNRLADLKTAIENDRDINHD